jgi:2,3-bisphosphoglycerate-dependent phosphoglycerate mutase
VRETADIALAGRDVPRLVDPRLNDPRYGAFEGGDIEQYRGWAAAVTSAAVPEPAGESRLAVVERYASAFQDLLRRPEDTVLVVFHSLPLSYALAARDGAPPAARMPLAEHATPHAFTAEQLAVVADMLGRWTANPTW